MVNLTILSAFRNAAGPQIERYFAQIDALACALSTRGDTLTLILGYGDSSDGTEHDLWEAASHRLIETLLLEVNHGGPHFDSIEHPRRFKQLAYVGNELLGCVLSSADIVGIIESDLIWKANVIVQLIEDLEHLPPLSAVAPMIMDGPQSFYDVFAFRKNGERFTKCPPYHVQLPAEVEQNPELSNVISLVEVDSAGSVLFMDAHLVTRGVRFSAEEAIVGLCRDIYAHGGSVYLDAKAKVFHP